MAEEKSGASLAVGPHKVEASVSEGTLGKLGSAVAWLFQNKDARVKITSALAQRVSDKIATGDSLDENELAFVSRVFGKEARAIGNREIVAETVQRVLPEVDSQLRALPPAESKPLNETFVSRSEEMASEPLDDRVREVFARILAGEISRPGTVSLRTLESVRLFDREIAEAFDKARRLAFNNELIILETGESTAEQRGLTSELISELQDAALLDVSASGGFMLRFGPDPVKWDWDYHDREMEVLSQYRNGTSSVRIAAARLTRTGREIATVMPPAPDESYFAEVARLMLRILGETGSARWKFKTESGWRRF